jgi:hypothetical protein
MDCYRSFSFRAGGNVNITTPELKQWVTGAAQHFWQADAGTSSTYNIQGYKNIDVYGIDLIGSVQSSATAAIGGVIVNDWSINVLVGGQPPLLGGFITTSPNYYNIDGNAAGNIIYPMGKFSNSLRFGTPLISTKFIQIQKTMCQGIGYETLGSVNLLWDLNFVVFYKFEDE